MTRFLSAFLTTLLVAAGSDPVAVPTRSPAQEVAPQPPTPSPSEAPSALLSEEPSALLKECQHWLGDPSCGPSFAPPTDVPSVALSPTPVTPPPKMIPAPLKTGGATSAAEASPPSVVGLMAAVVLAIACAQ